MQMWSDEIEIETANPGEKSQNKSIWSGGRGV